MLEHETWIDGFQEDIHIKAQIDVPKFLDDVNTLRFVDLLRDVSIRVPPFGVATARHLVERGVAAGRLQREAARAEIDEGEDGLRRVAVERGERHAAARNARSGWPMSRSWMERISWVRRNFSSVRASAMRARAASSCAADRNQASNGEGGFPHMTIEMFRVMGGFTYVHVPYKGSGEARTIAWRSALNDER